MKKLDVMGVAGCGESTLAAHLARSLACPMFEGDDSHLAHSQHKMRDGIPLTDSDREPRLDRLGQLMAWRAGGWPRRRNRAEKRTSLEAAPKASALHGRYPLRRWRRHRHALIRNNHGRSRHSRPR